MYDANQSKHGTLHRRYGRQRQKFLQQLRKSARLRRRCGQDTGSLLAGKKDEAAAAVPAELIDACHLVGPKERIQERLARWKNAGNNGQVAAMLLGSQQPEAWELVASEML